MFSGVIYVAIRASFALFLLLLWYLFVVMVVVVLLFSVCLIQLLRSKAKESATKASSNSSVKTGKNTQVGCSNRMQSFV
jgi:membrane protein implicated in regulation of membrane protease activity